MFQQPETAATMSKHYTITSGGDSTINWSRGYSYLFAVQARDKLDNRPDMINLQFRYRLSHPALRVQSYMILLRPMRTKPGITDNHLIIRYG